MIKGYMGKILYPVVFEFFNWQTRMKRICDEIPIKYLERKSIINRKIKRQRSWTDYFKFW